MSPVDFHVVQQRFEAAGMSPASLTGQHACLFSAQTLTVDRENQAKMAALVAAIERVIALPAYQDAVLAWAPDIARPPVAARGVFFGYDFHLAADGPQLIEINTNAGGAWLNTCLLAAHGQGERACALEDEFIAMFAAEWQLGAAAVLGATADTPSLRHVALLDEAPETQYLAPEFHLFKHALEARGIPVSIADPGELSVDAAGYLQIHGRRVDLVYNRLTDFALNATVNAHLRAVFEAGKVVLTPHPRAHALYADKRNLTLLSDPQALSALGVETADQQVLLAGIPSTRVVRAEAAEFFWQTRKTWFFKPAAGFGSRATYRGDKLTKRVFEEILAGDYIAQTIVPPSVHSSLALKADIRAYVYNARIQLLAARLYQGQTTNFRTPGGGFAPVFAV